jgi:ABC transporter DrrB family efflux protein
MLLGILPPTSGQAFILDYDAQQDSEQIKPRIGYMSQRFSLYADLTVQENLDFYGSIYGINRSRLRERREDVLALTSLGGQFKQTAGTLSGGWKQRLALACSLIHEPDVLFLDEPTAGIDPVARRHLWDLLFDLAGRGVTLFVTTHYMDEAERCTDVGYIFMSRLLVLGKTDELKALPAVTPPGTQRYELRVPHPTMRLSALRTTPGVRDATLFGETIHVLADGRLDAETLSKQFEIPREKAELRPIAPSLEDVFVTLTSEAESNRPHPNQQSPATDAETIPSRQPAKRRPHGTLYGLWAVLVKEFLHIQREPSTLFFMLVVPVMQTIIFGYAIETQIEDIPTVVFDMDGRHHAREFITAFGNTRRYKLVRHVHDEGSFHRAITSGRAKVGLRIPPEFGDRLLRGQHAQVQVLIDGSDSQVATTAQSTAQLLGQNVSTSIAQSKAEALQLAPSRDPTGHAVPPIEVRTRLLYNPNLESSHFFVPGLVGIILQLVTLFLTSFAVVRERELGTLEQLFVTPVGRTGLLLGKLVPYALVGFVETLIVITVMTYVFGVTIQGSLPLLLALAMLFMVCSLGLGLLVSTLAKTQVEAMQFAFVIMLPSVLLSGFVFPRSAMPLPIYIVTFAIPVTYFIEILRGIVLRGAGFGDLLSSVVGLTACGLTVLSLSVSRFRKRVS